VSQLPPIGAEARIPNPALKPFEFLIGEWRTTGIHPEMPGEMLRGRTSFAWHEGGAFLIMRSEVDHPAIPSGLAVVGSDGASGKFAMTYFDERGVSRIFEVTAGHRTATWRRDDPDFSQSTTITADPSGDSLDGKGRMSRKGGAWTDDLSQVYRREGPPEPGAR
jgi:hypothetical protein